MSNQNPYFPENQQWQGQQQNSYQGGQYSPNEQMVYGQPGYGDSGPQQQYQPLSPSYSPVQNPGSLPQGPYTAYPGVMPMAPMVPQSDRGGGLAIAGFVLGIVGIVVFWAFYLGLPVAIVGVILSALGRRSVQRRTLATIGLVLSILALVLSLCVFGVVIYGVVTHVRS